MSGEVSIAFAPAVPWWAIAALGVAGAALLAATFAARAPGRWWRMLAIAALLAALANPIALVEERRPLPDIGVVVVDDSRSQDIGERRARSRAGQHSQRRRGNLHKASQSKRRIRLEVSLRPPPMACTSA